ncbi:alanine racemase [Rhodobacteraceae bacterium]|nr:alanine racemase [Paracoccaceae bacterium]
MNGPQPNAHLIGKRDGRQRLATPALIVEVPLLEENLQTAARLAKAAGKNLRPHFKAHKSLEIAERQISLGAVGISVATVTEAEAVSGLGTDILLTSVISTPAQQGRIADLAAEGSAITLVLDSPEAFASLERELRDRDTALDILIDVDMGRSRSGCVTIEDAQILAEQVDKSEQVRFRGLQTYAGQLSHMRSYAERKREHLKTLNLINSFQAALSGIWPDNATVSGGSTGSMNIDLDGPLTELQCGSYALMDVEYLNIESGWEAWPFEQAVFVQSSVLSANWPNHVVTDAGDKWFRSKYNTAPVVTGAGARRQLELLSDEHARLNTKGTSRPSVGDRIECIPPHCDPTIGLYSAIHACDGDELIEIWPTQARGQ